VTFAGYVVVEDNEQEAAVNVVTLIGNLASDVDVRDVGEDRKVAHFLLAVDRPDKGADFVRVNAWNKQAETCSRYLAKGRRVAVDGRLRSRSWEDPDGKRRSAVEVVANRVEFLSSADGGRTDDMPFEGAAMA
jgi:single-strand DNA-binding protein